MGLGFFEDSKLSVLKINKEKGFGCNFCKLKNQSIHTPQMGIGGAGNLKALLLGEAPGSNEDLKGIQFVGDAGEVLKRSLKKFGYNINDFYLYNSVNCRTMNRNGSNRTPTEKEIAVCRVNVFETIEKIRPFVVFLFGGTAVSSLYRKRFTDTSISRWRGLIVPDSILKCWTIPIFHPSYLLRNQKDLGLKKVFLTDLEKGLKFFENVKDYPSFIDYHKNVKCLENYEDLCAVLEYFPFDNFSFDYETSGIKPYNEERYIWAVSFSDGEKSYSFPLEYKNFWDEKQIRNLKNLWCKILISKRGKISHNLLFEDLWSRVHLGIEDGVPNWKMCTMNAAHVEDNRRGYSGLKFQSFIKFGIEPYGEKIDSYLVEKGSDKGKGVNNLWKVDLNSLLMYNGLDSLFAFKLYKHFENLFRNDDKLGRAYRFIHKSLLTISDIHPVGINADENLYLNSEKELKKRIEKINERIQNTNEALEFKEKRRREFNPNSSDDISELLYEILKLKPVKKTEKDNASVDKDSLEHYGNIQICNLILLKRKLDKILGTYLAQFKREIYQGKIYPSYNLHIPQTYRSSSSNPNFQNIPKRDEEAKKIIRSGLKPSVGNKIMEIDYGELEVRVAACYTGDLALINYINNPKSDMHRDVAAEIFMLEKKEITRKIRYQAKNGFVFPEFYGSYYVSCAKNIWPELKGLKTESGDFLLEHLRRKGIKNLNDYVNLLNEFEKKFWKKFWIFREWQSEAIYSYLKKGYIESFLGFRFGGYLTKNMVINYRIQGTAFHFLLWSLNHINKVRKSKGWKTKIMGQIHDSGIFDLFPAEEQEVVEVSKYIMTEKIREEFEWICVPLKAEIEISGVDESWYQIKKRTE